MRSSIAPTADTSLNRYRAVRATRFGEQSDRLIRAVTVACGEGLKGKMEQVVRSFPEIQASRDVRIEIDPQAKSYHYEAA